MTQLYLEKRRQAEIYISQARAYRRLLMKVNDGGRYNKEIGEIQKKINQARRALRILS